MASRIQQLKRALEASPEFAGHFFRLALVGVLLVAFLLVAVINIGRYLTVGEVSVPSVVGMDVDEAVRVLERYDFEVQNYPDNVPGAQVNSVTTQSPKPGTVVRRGRGVTIGVHTPPANALVPRLTGLSQEEAARMLSDVNLLLGEVSYVHDNAPAGRVITQSPEAGATLSTNSSVSVVVSRGVTTSEATLPDLVGLTLEEAEKQLQELGFRRIEAVATRLSFDRPGVILVQSPQPGQTMPVSAPVVLYYALSGRNVVKVPELQGQSLLRAQLMLRAAGLRVGWVSYVDDPEKPQGVIEVRPAGFTLIGGPVALTVNGSAGGNNVLLPLDNGGNDDNRFGLRDLLPGGLFRPGRDGDNPLPPEDLPAGARSVRINFNPADYSFLQGQEYEFRLVVIDDEGQRDAINRRLRPGETVSTSVRVFGEAELQTYINGVLFQQWKP